VLAGQTIRLAQFTILSNTRAGAIAEANALFANGGFGGRAGDFLSQPELSSLQNFQVLGTAGNDSITIDPGSTSGTVKITINGVATDNFQGSGTLKVLGLGGDDTFTVSGGLSGSVAVDGGNGNDTYVVNLSTALGGFASIADTGVSGTDRLVVHATPQADYIGKQGGIVKWWLKNNSPLTQPNYPPPPLATVPYSGMEAVTVAGCAGADYILDPDSTDTTILGGPDDDTIVLENTTGTGVQVDGEDGSDTFIVNFGGLEGAITIGDTGTTGTDELTVDGADGDNMIVAAGNQVTAGTQTIKVTSSLSSLIIDGGSGNNVITVAPVSVPVQSLVLNGGPADDTIQVASMVAATTTITAGSGGTDTLQGGGGTNTLVGSTGGGSTTFVDNGGTNAVVAGTGTNVLVPGTGHTTAQPPSEAAAPLVFNDAYSTSVNGVLSVAAAGVLANDFSANGQSITAVLLAGLSHGGVTLNVDGSFQHTPAAGFAGVDSFVYQAKGNDGTLSAPAAVGLRVFCNFGGFLAPLGNNLAFNQNRTIPIKWQLKVAAPSPLAVWAP
jgi:hypothetical protein